MSTVEGYTIDVYCDGPTGQYHRTFSGHDKHAAEHQAREAGWIIRSDPAPVESQYGGRLAFCPACVEKMKLRKPGDEQCTASMGRRGRCQATATMAYGSSRVMGHGRICVATVKRCAAHPLSNAVSAAPLDRSSEAG